MPQPLPLSRRASCPQPRTGGRSFTSSWMSSCRAAGLALALIFGVSTSGWAQQATPAAAAKKPAAKKPPGPLPPLQTAKSNICIPVSGLTFEITGTESFLVKRGEESVALVRMGMFIPASLNSLRFLSSDLCQSGAKSQVMINERLYEVEEITKLPTGSKALVAQLSDRGTSATVPGR